MDVLSILEKKREPVEGMRVTIHSKRAPEYPKVYTDIHVIYHVQGNVHPEALAHAIDFDKILRCRRHVGQMRGHHLTYEIVSDPDAVMQKTDVN